MPPTAESVWGDLAEMPQVLALADQVRQHTPVLNVLLHNAGVYEHTRHLTADGFERTMAVNHFAPFLLTQALLDLVKASPQSCIIGFVALISLNTIYSGLHWVMATTGGVLGN